MFKSAAIVVPQQTSGANRAPDIEGPRKALQEAGLSRVIQTSLESLFGFLETLDSLSRASEGYILISELDGTHTPENYAFFIEKARFFTEADLILGLTASRDKNPLRVAMKGQEGTGLMPSRIKDDPDAFEIVALTNIGFASEFVAGPIWGIHPRVLKENLAVKERGFVTLHQYYGHLLKTGYRFYGLPASG